MTERVRELVRPPGEKLVACIEQILDRAKSGEIRQFVGVGTCADGGAITIIGNPDDLVRLMEPA